jgi:hypothetical protein
MMPDTATINVTFRGEDTGTTTDTRVTFYDDNGWGTHDSRQHFFVVSNREPIEPELEVEFVLKEDKPAYERKIFKKPSRINLKSSKNFSRRRM